ncbi:hypothetical protein Tco_0863233 [Tanacetum coccineum]
MMSFKIRQLGESGDNDDSNYDDSDNVSDNDGNDDDSDDDDVHVKWKDVKHGKEGKGDAEMTDTGHDDFTLTDYI